VSTLDLRSLVSALNEHDVRFVVIGGVAVGAHGYVRATMDLEIVPDPERANLTRLAGALRALESALPLADGQPFEIARDAERLERRENMTVETRYGELDVVQRAAGVPSFPVLDATAEDSDLLGVAVRICSLEHLRQMKRVRASTQDLADLERLPPQ
jgi:hypothetical protein